MAASSMKSETDKEVLAVLKVDAHTDHDMLIIAYIRHSIRPHDHIEIGIISIIQQYLRYDPRKFAFNQQPKSQHIQIRNKTTIKNTEYDGYGHSITFGEVIDCVEYKQYRIKFKINKMSGSFFIGYGANKQALKDVDNYPGYGANKATTTGIWVGNNNNFYLYDKNHDSHKIKLLGGEWTNGWYNKYGVKNGYVFVMEFDFKGKVFSLYDQNNRKLFSLPNEDKSVLPMFSLGNKDDEIEIVECVLY